MKRWTSQAFAAVGVMLWAIGALRAARDTAPSVPDPSNEELPRPPLRLEADSLSAFSEVVTEHDLFRLSRRPSQVQRGQSAPETIAPAAITRPTLSLAGIVGGPPWVALLEGVPGRDATVALATGDTVAGLRVRSVDRNVAVIAGTDTVWRLILRRLSP